MNVGSLRALYAPALTVAPEKDRRSTLCLGDYMMNRDDDDLARWHEARMDTQTNTRSVLATMTSPVGLAFY